MLTRDEAVKVARDVVEYRVKFSVNLCIELARFILREHDGPPTEPQRNGDKEAPR